MPILGTIASSRLTAVAGDYELISKTSVGSDTASISLSSIPQDYKHLTLITLILSTSTSNYAQIIVRVNGDTNDNNYSKHYLQTNYANGVVAGGGNNSSWDYAYAAGTARADRIVLNMFNFYDYTSTNKTKSFMNTAQFLNNGLDTSVSQGYGGIYTGNYRSTSALTSLSFTPNTGSIKADSVFWLYGVRG